MIILGSGGHSAEMSRLLLGVLKRSANEFTGNEAVNELRYEPRSYVCADTDHLSQKKIIMLLENVFGLNADNRSDQFYTVPRSREVGQSWISSIWTTLVASIHSLLLFWRLKPALIICNGPGTCVPFVYIAFLLKKMLFLSEPRIVYVESFARVSSLSLSGKLVYPVADKFIVQWRHLLEKYPKAQYADRLV
ncbi:hypothetical protein MP638_002916 [Amoeboaphelidium occidentale]|nr:hypothetical protein MP638_002916 [Amoeboaphelidium occidentale]